MFYGILATRRINSLWLKTHACRFTHAPPRMKQCQWSVNRFLEPKLEQVVSKHEWKNIRSEIMTNSSFVNTKNVDGLIVRLCRTSPNALVNALAYTEMMRESNIEMNTATSIIMIQIYYDKSLVMPLNDEEKRQIREICRNVQTQNPDILTNTMVETLVLGLSQTNDWRQGFELFQKHRKMFKTLPMTSSCALIQRAFQEDAPDLGFGLLNNLVSKNREMVRCRTFETYWNFCRRQPKDVRRHIEAMLELVQNQRVVVSKRTIDSLQVLLKEINVPITITEVLSSGKCLNCKGSLKKIEVTSQEYVKLLKALHDKVLIRGNVYMQSTPKEMNSFLKFLEDKGQFDWVIDGLNVAHKLNTGARQSWTKEQARTLAMVLKALNGQRQRIFVLGRKHMTNWPSKDWNFIQTNCEYFLVDNESKDDTFILYAALKGGARTNFISGDMMRNHAHLLGPELKSVFQRWQQKHQYNIETVLRDGQFEIRPTMQFNIHAHKNDGVWHIPFLETYESIIPDKYYYYQPSSWACLKL